MVVFGRYKKVRKIPHIMMLFKQFVNRILLTSQLSFNPLRYQLSTTSAGFKADSHDTDEEIVHRDDRPDIRIPEYPFKSDEPLEKKRLRLLYQSRKRGMLENDLLLSTFAAKYLKTMNKDQIDMYDKLINKPSNDWDIYHWGTGTKEIPAEYNNEVMQLFKEHVRNDFKEKRLRMPDL